MFQLESCKQIQLMQQVANYNHTSRYERAIADTLKEADFAGHADFATPPPPPASRLAWHALVGRLARRASAQA